MSSAEQLERIRTNILNRIEEITANPKPNYSIDGQSVSWQSYLESLMQQLERINEQINSETPFEEVSRGIT
jgi:predicted RND superfamily exporter protein